MIDDGNMTIDQLRDEAEQDYAAGRSGRTLLKWAFMNAEAVARQVCADRELRTLEDQERDCRFRAAALPSEAAGLMVMENAPAPVQMCKAKQELASAVEWVTATASVMALLEKAPAAKVATVPRLDVHAGGRK